MKDDNAQIERIKENKTRILEQIENINEKQDQAEKQLKKGESDYKDLSELVANNKKKM